MADMSNIENLPDVDFIDDLELVDIQELLLDNYTSKYTEITGEQVQLAKADPFRIILLSCAQVIYQGMQMINKAGMMNLLKYAYDEYLDNLAALRGITRNPAVPAKTTLKFTLSAARESATPIPAGTQATAESEAYFATTEYAEIPAGELEASVPAECVEAGEAGNGYAPGEVSTLVDSIGFIESVSNTTETSGGFDEESDDDLAERVLLGPSGYSTAGPNDAYEYLVKSYRPDVGDVRINSPSPGVVDIRVAMQDGSIPDDGVVALLQDFIAQSGRRPLTDKVQVSKPAPEKFAVEITYYISRSKSSATEAIKAQAEAAVEEYRAWQTAKIGRDINPDELVYRVIGAGVKRVSVAQPSYRAVSDISKAECTSVKVTYGGLEDD